MFPTEPDHHGWTEMREGQFEELTQECDALRKALDHALSGLDDIAEYEKDEGRRNSFVATTARGTARRARAMLLPSEKREKA